ncbi:MAG: energy-coupling factor transporter transmembrane protein EcfT [Clostridia bacterium]|nr:energy-coupling factor transporter transmembrane protein EcfT [Clostridia bacterium]
MNLDVTLGQYFEGNSFLHRMDPRAKLVVAIAYIVVLFLARSVSAFLLVLLVTAMLIAISTVPLRTILKGLKPILFLVAFTAILNVFWYKGETVLFQWRFITVYQEGLINAVMMALRIALLIAGSGVILTYTTTPIALTDGLERLLSPLKKIKLPVHEFSMMMTIALRFIPTLVEETHKIMNAQKARGVDFSSGGLIKRAKALIPILVPLFISSFRRADELATAMECRCYHGGEGRTRMTVLHLRFSDIASLLGVIAFGAGVVLLNLYYPIFKI